LALKFEFFLWVIWGIFCNFLGNVASSVLSLHLRNFLPEEEEILVPIRLEIDIEGKRLRDSFTWNFNEKLITPEQFANSMCEDLDLPQIFESAIATSIKHQLEAFREFIRTFSYYTSNNGLILIQLDLRIHDLKIKDQFEWDITNKRNNPESFARSMCGDLGLSAEFSVAIAHNIREQLAEQSFKYSINNHYNDNTRILNNYNDTRVPFEVIRHCLEDIQQWGPQIIKLSKQEIERLEQKQENYKNKNTNTWMLLASAKAGNNTMMNTRNLRRTRSSRRGILE